MKASRAGDDTGGRVRIGTSGWARLTGAVWDTGHQAWVASMGIRSLNFPVDPGADLWPGVSVGLMGPWPLAWHLWAL